MPTTTVTIHTDSVLKREAQTIFESQGLTLEAGLNYYLQLVVEQEEDAPLTLYQVADEDVPQDVWGELAELEAMPKKDLIVFTKETDAY